MADSIDWVAIDNVTTTAFAAGHARPALPSRLIAGLLYLEHAFKLSDEPVVAFWLENAYWQVFMGETYLQTEPPIDPSSLSRWRKRLGEESVEEVSLLKFRIKKLLQCKKCSVRYRRCTLTPNLTRQHANPRLL